MALAAALPTRLVDTDDLDAFEFFCSRLTLQQKVQMALEEFQRSMLAPYFAGAIETIIVIPKKNGKSVTIAALALWDLFTTDNADVVIVAASVRQGDIIFQHCRHFISKSPELQAEFDVKPGFKEIRAKRDLGRIRVMAADEDTLDGVEPTLGIIEEYHRHKTSELYGIVRDGLDTRNGRMVTITTAGSDELSPLGKLRAQAHKWPIQKRDGKHLYCESADGLQAFHEWALAPDDDATDMALVKQANPLSVQTIARLKARYDGRQTDARWMRFGCGIWTNSDDSAIKPLEWDVLINKAVTIPRRGEVVIGLDLAWVIDTTALVPLHWASEDRRIIGVPIILEPPGDGERLDDRAVVAAILHMAGIKQFDRSSFMRELSADKPIKAVQAWANAIAASPFGYNVKTITYDPNAEGSTLAHQLQREHGIPFNEFKQENTALARADGRFMEALRRKEFIHNGHEILRAHALNAIEVSLPGAGERWYFGRPKRGPRKPMDALRAVSMANDTLVAEAMTPKRTNEFAFL